MPLLKTVVLSSETIVDDTRANVQYEVFTLLVRKGMSRWQMKRKYNAFVSLYKILQANFQLECITAGMADNLLSDSLVEFNKQRESIDVFLFHLSKNEALQTTSPIRQFLEVKNPIAVFKENIDKKKSLLAFPVFPAPNPKLVKAWFPFTWVEMVVLASIIVTFPPVFLASFHVLLQFLQPVCAAWVCAICLWYVSLEEGVVDFMLEKVNFERSKAMWVRNPDLPLYWILLGVFLGLGLGAGNGLALFLARISIVLALVNLSFLILVATDKLSVY